ncbi:MAG: precorrin-6y C5,15-methyltransferase (decarboxylating) subunit CbiE [Elainellaceae cyanobacterium]
MGRNLSHLPPVHVVGIGLDGAAGLAPSSRQQVEAADVLVGSERQLSYFPEHPGDRWSLDNLLTWLQNSATQHAGSATRARIVVLASGDPLFFGVGRLLLQHLPPERLMFHPHLSAVQLAFSRIKLPWQDAEIISAHGRSPDALLTALRRGAAKLAILTDGVITPAAIAQMLLSLGLGDRYQIWVCEALGSPQERVRSARAADLVNAPDCAPLNVVVLQRCLTSPTASAPIIGIEDAQFASFPDRPGLMTKKPVRLLALGQLELQNGQVVWDIGAGTGSVSIEMARLCPRSQIYAVEKSAAGIALVRDNMAQFKVANVAPVRGRAPDCLPALPDPHRVFVGGSDGNLAQILGVAQARLQAGGMLVAALATLENVAIATQWLADRPLEISTAWRHQFLQMQINCSVPVGPLTRFSPLNPVTLLTLSRQNLQD